VTTVVTEAAVYCSADVERAVAVVSRIGGGRYKAVSVNGGDLPGYEGDSTFDTYEEALAAAEAFGAGFDKAGGAADLAAHTIAVAVAQLAEKAARIADQDARIADLEAQLAAK
jgi:hypothetical protein